MESNEKNQRKDKQNQKDQKMHGFDGGRTIKRKKIRETNIRRSSRGRAERRMKEVRTWHAWVHAHQKE